MEITGKIFAIEEIEQKTDSFKVQNFYLDCTRFDPETGERRENFLKFQVTNQRTEALKTVSKDDKVKVTFFPNGRFFQHDGKDAFAQNFNVTKIEKN